MICIQFKFESLKVVALFVRHFLPSPRRSAMAPRSSIPCRLDSTARPVAPSASLSISCICLGPGPPWPAHKSRGAPQRSQNVTRLFTFRGTLLASIAILLRCTKWRRILICLSYHCPPDAGIRRRRGDSEARRGAARHTELITRPGTSL